MPTEPLPHDEAHKIIESSLGFLLAAYHKSNMGLLVLKLAVRAMMLKYNSKAAQEAVKSNLLDQVTLSIDTYFKNELEMKTISPDLKVYLKDLAVVFVEELFYPPDGLTGNL